MCTFTTQSDALNKSESKNEIEIAMNAMFVSYISKARILFQ